ncbi:MAG: glucose-1-phosphate cytidylyltransferase [Deltaproteobacteria bacterium]|nr:glucose-1-phosphate cytidylyltransferase [Deltaproteobacteria bacterium]
MKVLILAGGYGTRLSEETDIKPKPMVEIDGKPLLWHIMKIYSYYGFNEFVILLGYKGNVIKDYFADYFLHQSAVTIDLVNNQTVVHNNNSEPWKVTLLDTGVGTMTGGRVLKAREFVNNETFMLAYGDTLMDIDIRSLLDFHKSHGKTVTMTIAQPKGKYGAVEYSKNGKITNFEEKPKGDGTWVNGGFFVCEPQVFKYILHGDDTIFERSPLENLSKDGEIFAYNHNGFYRCIDTLKDKKSVNDLCAKKEAKWKIWDSEYK